MISQCVKCGERIYIEDHHVYPAFMDNKKREGQTIELCKRCHGIVHQTIIPPILFRHIENKQSAIADVIQSTLNWIKTKDDYQIKCKCCKADLDIEDRVCPYCDKVRDGVFEDD